MAKQTTCSKCGGGHATGSAVCSMSTGYAQMVERDKRERKSKGK